MFLPLTLLLLIFLFIRFRWRAPAPPTLQLAFVAGLFALPLFHLVPLPPALWTALPGREEVRSGLELLGSPLPWLPLSMDPPASFGFFLALLPPAAAILLVGRSRSVPAVLPAVAVLALALVSLLLGIMQVSQGSQSPLYFHAITNRDSAVGFFANSNHFATLLLLTLPLSAALLAGLPGRHPVGRHRLSVFAIHLLVVAVAILLTRSVAGLLMLMPVAAASAALLRGGASPRRLSLAVVALLAPALAFYAFSGAGFHTSLGNDPLDRLGMARTTLAATADTFPVGGGVGAFPAVYKLHEDLSTVERPYVNHAHDDWLEWLLEAGLAGVILAVLLLVWAGRATVAAWLASEAWPRAASIIVWLVMVHSLVDYPVRTPAIALILAWAAALLALHTDARRAEGDEPPPKAA